MVVCGGHRAEWWCVGGEVVCGGHGAVWWTQGSVVVCGGHGAGWLYVVDTCMVVWWCVVNIGQ